MPHSEPVSGWLNKYAPPVHSMNVLQFAHKYPEAYKHLSPRDQYSDLIFSGPDAYNRLFCNPRKTAIATLGNWIAVFDPDKQVWSKYEMR